MDAVDVIFGNFFIESLRNAFSFVIRGLFGSLNTNSWSKRTFVTPGYQDGYGRRHLREFFHQFTSKPFNFVISGFFGSLNTNAWSKPTFVTPGYQDGYRRRHLRVFFHQITSESIQFFGQGVFRVAACDSVVETDFRDTWVLRWMP